MKNHMEEREFDVSLADLKHLQEADESLLC